ncbi:bifunctional hydroxymethylpyrimidine kinase/phosphomethylpyrimidine kinase [Gordonia sp. SID5947]|uniref:bifunctional hydroxymethylpyrimidine kinase/phosphomethylpyrimidine kinase n=1 Tax=Gordonia sp. SID5947 TaxID=2690315 RepID=UPI00136A49DA|nr:bifunctional hydroxymethylpyrimidine kinase/phosphomethylpyrimidine kinase [Gordonia sp. SID5947]MYR07130.1 bifunctional hydroxymethylpyrimidine kinase/phosphomethylpyrimidine kinase [Gordonia sp. SID5947]
MSDDLGLPTAAPGVTPARVLTIAGSDSGGGAGIQADMRTFALLGLHACVAVTAVTVQNSVGVQGFQEIEPTTVAAQMRSVVTDIGVGAAKSGMLASAPIIEAVADACIELRIGRDHGVPLVVDPVCASMHGDALLAAEALDTLRTRLIPLATVVTPNLDEVRLITGIDVVDAATQRAAAHALHDLGAHWALVKGGHLRSSDHSPDLLFDGDEFHEFVHPRIATTHDHGAGDTLAAATASALAHGYSVPDAVAFAKRWVTRGLESAYPLGAGHGPVNPLWRVSHS